MSFPIHCDGCGASFKLPDSLYEKKVKGKAVTIRCKHCGGEIFVDGTQLGAGAEPAKQKPAPSEPETEPEPARAADDAEPTTVRKATEQASAAPTPKPETGDGKPVRDLSVEASLAGVFDDVPAEPAPTSLLADDVVHSVREPTVQEALGRKPPAPPQRSEQAAPETVDVDLDEAEFDIDFASLSAPLDLKAPSLAELTTPPSPEVDEAQERPAGKWVLKPPEASLTTVASSGSQAYLFTPVSSSSHSPSNL